MGMIDIQEIDDQLDMRFLFERESLDFREGRGVSGIQLNLRCCPACGDSRWRTYFGEDTGRGNCFVCGQGFGKTTFVKAYLDDAPWREVFEFIRDVLREQGWRPKRTVSVAVDPGEVKLPANDPLPLEDGSNLQYLEDRGFDAQIVRYFDLRWCRFGWWFTTGQDGKPFNQDFSNRVLIPVYDLDGTLKTFQGRDLTGLSDRKYLFPSGLPGTGRYLLNGHNVIATSRIVIAEGIFDVAAVKLALDADPALRDVVPVGSFGKHLSYGDAEANDQLGRLAILRTRGLKSVTMMWDGEPRALTAALDAAKLITGIGLETRIALLPKGRDPNETTPEIVRDAFRSARTWTPLLDVKLRLRNPYGTA